MRREIIALESTCLLSKLFAHVWGCLACLPKEMQQCLPQVGASSPLFTHGLLETPVKSKAINIICPVDILGVYQSGEGG